MHQRGSYRAEIHQRPKHIGAANPAAHVRRQPQPIDRTMNDDAICCEFAAAAGKDDIDRQVVDVRQRHPVEMHGRAVRCERIAAERPDSSSDPLRIRARHPGEAGDARVQEIEFTAFDHPIPRCVRNAARRLDDESVAFECVLIQVEKFHTAHWVDTWAKGNTKPEHTPSPTASRPRHVSDADTQRGRESARYQAAPESHLRGMDPADCDDHMGIEIRRIRPGEAETLKHMRLALLADSPAAFGSTHEREFAFTDETWAERAADSSAGSTRATFLAFDGDEAVGIVGAGRARDGTDSVVELVSMWTAPTVRRRASAAAGRRRARVGHRDRRPFGRAVGHSWQRRPQSASTNRWASASPATTSRCPPTRARTKSACPAPALHPESTASRPCFVSACGRVGSNTA